MGLFNKVTGFFRRKSNRDNSINSIVNEKVSIATNKIKAQMGYGYGYGPHAGTSGGAKYPFGLSNSGSSQILNHVELRQNSRSAYHDTPLAKAMVDRFADNAGSGYQLESTPDAEILGLTLEQAEIWARDFESRFALWAGSKKQHRSELMTFNQSHRLYSINQSRDGENFVRFFYSNDRSLQNPLQFEFIDPNQIRGVAFTSTYVPFAQNDGIIRDSRGREKAYQIAQIKHDPKGYGTYDAKTINRISSTGRIMMIHGFAPEYPGQMRGYPRISHILQEFENLTDFSLAQIKKAINQSNITMYTKPSQDDDASNPLEGILTNRGAGPVVEQFGSDPVPDPAALNIDTPTVSFCPLPEATLDTPGSTGVFNLTKGEDLKPFDNSAPSDSYDSFVSAFATHLAASVSMPLEVLLMKFNANYSASRAALILFWRISEIWKNEYATDYLNPIVEMWASGEIAAGRLNAPGWSDPILRAAWLKNNWIGSPMPNIDPQKTAKADELYVNMGAQTLDRVSRNLNGSAGKANRAQLKREFEELPPSPFNSNLNIEEGQEKEKE